MATFSKRLLVFVSLSVSSFLTVVNAQSIKGKVLDATTGEPLVGAVVKLENTKFRTIVKLDGTYSFAKLPLGNYTIKVNYEGFANGELQTITLSDNSTKTISFDLKPTANELSSVTVSTSTEKNGEVGARRLEKISEPIINVLSSKSIQLLPDITVANALQRVSGVTIERSSNGEGRYPIIRGMEKRYINTLVNGIKIPSPDNKNRFIPLDLFPSELLERLEVSKNLTPSMEGDAIGGTINLVMKDAPEKELFHISAATGYSDIFMNQAYQHFDHNVINKQSPNEIHGASYVSTPADFSLTSLHSTNIKAPINTTLNASYGNRYGKTKQFGLIVSGSFQNIYKGTKSTFFLPNAQPGVNNTPQFVDLLYRKYSNQSQRFGLNAKLDYQINKNNKITLVNTFVRLDDFQYRYTIDSVLLNHLADESFRSIWQYQSIYNTTLQGIHQLANSFKIDWSLVYSIANNHRPDVQEFTHEYPAVYSTEKDLVQNLSTIWTHNSDKDYDAYLNLTKATKIANRRTEFKVGGMIRVKRRDNFYDKYSLNASKQVYTTMDAAKFVFNPVLDGMVDRADGNNYTFDETIGAGYFQAKIQLSDKLEAIGGVRVENTNQKYNTQESTDNPYVKGKIWYTDVLPSLQFKYLIDNKNSIRLAYNKALSRPGFAELIPAGAAIFETFKETGNPSSLNHTTSDNFELRYEMFGNKADQLLLGAFYKDIQDPIEFSAVKSGVTSQELQPSNFGKSNNYGFEAVYTKYIGAFGIMANYTYTNSTLTVDKIFKYYDPTKGSTSKILSETRPLQGQSKHIGNLSFMYKNPKNGLDVQVAFVYTGERVALVSPYYGLDYWQAPTTQLDLSFEKKIVKGISVYGKLNNLTNTPFILQLHQSYNNYIAQSGSQKLDLQTDPNSKIIVQKDLYKATYLFGFRFKL